MAPSSISSEEKSDLRLFLSGSMLNGRQRKIETYLFRVIPLIISCVSQGRAGMAIGRVGVREEFKRGSMEFTRPGVRY